MLSRIRFLLFAGAMLAPAVAAAQTIGTPPVGSTRGGDTVVLKDGTVLHGTIGEMTPGQALTITLGDGSARTLEWTAIERVDIDRAKAAPAPPAPARSTTTLHLDGASDDVMVQTLPPGGTAHDWTSVCRGACDRDLPTDGVYRVDGPGMRASHAFQLPSGSASYRLERASGAGFVGGLTLLILGGAAALNGIGFIAFGAAWQNTYSNANDFLIGGAITTGVGAALAIVGFVLLNGNARTKLTPTGTTAAPTRVPAWRDAVPTWTPRFATIGVPAFGGSF